MIDFYGIGFIPHHSSAIFLCQIGETAGVGGKFFENGEKLVGVQGGQASFQRWRVFAVIESGEEGEFLFSDGNEAIAVALNIPFVILVFNAARDS